MGYERIKTEHVGAKNRGGAWMTRFEAKQAAKRKRRQVDDLESGGGIRLQSEYGYHETQENYRAEGGAAAPRAPGSRARSAGY